MKEKKKMVIKVDNIVSFANAVGNPLRVKIINLCTKKAYTLPQLQKKLEIKSYKNLYNHIKVLSEAGLVKAKKQLNAQGQAVIVETSTEIYINRLLSGIVDDFRNAFKILDKDVDGKIYKLFEENNFNKLKDKEIKDKIEVIDKLGMVSYLLIHGDKFNLDLELTEYGRKKFVAEKL